MIYIISSKAASPNTLLQEAPRAEDEETVQWLCRHREASEEHTHLVLVGGTSTAAFRLRVAQSHVRHDLVPSYWSHVMLLGKVARNIGTTPVHEISLDPPQGFAELLRAGAQVAGAARIGHANHDVPVVGQPAHRRQVGRARNALQHLANLGDQNRQASIRYERVWPQVLVKLRLRERSVVMFGQESQEIERFRGKG